MNGTVFSTIALVLSFLAKSYTDAREAVLDGKIGTNASAIAALDTRLGGLTFVINADDLGLDIVID